VKLRTQFTCFTSTKEAVAAHQRDVTLHQRDCSSVYLLY
jgi:hypothetical protein